MTELTVEEKQKRVREAQETTQYILKESKRRENELAVNTAKSVMEKFQKIELKERCLRVKFLDWLSDKLSSWSKSVHEMSVRIDSPCVIKLPEKKEEAKQILLVKGKTK
jgi:hypothetical protein